ncbi:MAG TPA: hypothetical protein EYP29_05205, partial [Thermoplasmata archaeon]|nr:hypothetical protein [Thermoplasmata archaeon]
MTYTQQLKKLLNELKLAKGLNSLVVVELEVEGFFENVKRLIKEFRDVGFEVISLNLSQVSKPLKEIVNWKKTPKNALYFIFNLGRQFLHILTDLNIHRDLLADVKRPVVVAGTKHELGEIAKYAPDFWRFRSGSYKISFKKESEVQEGYYLSAPADKDLSRAFFESVYKSYFSLLPTGPRTEEEKEGLLNRLHSNKYLLKKVKEDYKKAEIYLDMGFVYLNLGELEKGKYNINEGLKLLKKLKNMERTVEVYNALGVFFFQVGELKGDEELFKESFEKYEKAREINENCAEAWS